MDRFQEAERDVPIVDHTDVVVCGGGPAGVCAAIAAARTGAKTRLLEVHGSLGGIWTSGLLSWIIDSADKPGIMADITEELDRRGARATRVPGGKNYAYDVEQMKLLLDEMCLEAGVEVRLLTRVVAAARDLENRLAVVITESKSGREAWAARAFVDATGDGDLGALAGCGFDMGHPETGKVQAMSLIALVTGVRFLEVEPFVGGSLAEPKERLLAEMQKAGVAPSYGKPTLFRVHEDLMALVANHEYGAYANDAEAITQAMMRARREVRTLVAGLCSLGGVWKDMRIVATPAQIGVREGRRIQGRYTVSTEDLRIGATHDDAICRVTMGIDVHSTDASKTRGIEPKPVKSKPYDIPLRALIAKDVDGLLMAGRCISGDFWAHSSYRVTGNAAAMGQAAGVTATLAARLHCLPHEVPWPKVSEALGVLNQNVNTEVPAD